MSSSLNLTQLISTLQVEQQNIFGYTRWRCFLPSSVAIICNPIFDRERWVSTNFKPKPKNPRFLWNSTPWGEAISSPLYHSRGVADPLWPSMGCFCWEEIPIWPFSYPSSRPENFPKSKGLFLTMASIVSHKPAQSFALFSCVSIQPPIAESITDKYKIKVFDPPISQQLSEGQGEQGTRNHL